ncbi:MAG: HlyD family efflux transporter periplasmic adaptor subunit [Pirellulaceae bacterium]|nr:HlyD family efflux transporter periplasmic adaptor subunit [Pirellulaceae bacterium]
MATLYSPTTTSPLHVPLAPAPTAAKGNAPSPPPSPDPLLVQETKNEIRSLVQEIAQLAQQEIPPEEFYAGFLGRIVSAMAAVGGAVWTSGENGLSVAYQVNLAGAELDDSTAGRQQHSRLLKNAMLSGNALLVSPRAGGSGEDAEANPSAHLLVLAPLRVEQEVVGLIEIFQRPGGGPTTQRGYVRFVSQMADLAADYLKNQRLRFLHDRQQLWKQLEQFLRSIHASLDVRQAGFSIVNEGRRLIGCDRVSLAVQDGGKLRVVAVSGLDTIDRRATEVRHLSKLAQVVARTNEPLWHAAGSGEAAPQIDQHLQPYIDASHARLVAVLPLLAPIGGAKPGPDSDKSKSQRKKLVGALIIEQLREAKATDLLRSRSEMVAEHSAAALANALEHSGLFLMPLWRVLGKAASLFRGRTFFKTAGVLALLGGIIYGLAVIPADFEVSAKGKLQPVERRDIFARIDGDVVKVPVRHGQTVSRGDVLAELNSPELAEEFEHLLGRQKAVQEKTSSTNKRLLDSNRGGASRLTPYDESRLAGELVELRQEAENIRREQELFAEKQKRLRVLAEEAGQVVTWEVETSLLRRPVQRGQVLMTLANPDGPWELELYVPERRLRHILAAQEGGDGAADETRPALDVTFMLSSHPGEEYHGQIVEIEQSAEVRGEEGNTILVRVEVDRDTLPHLHDQTTVTAKLYCGRKSLGYTWFCDLIETVQAKVLFWL